ncbi:MAG: hypothetical protein GXP15_10375 [Gammaproteobacteria bacterium]|nr:hypothetical protein [Gammaproteobacteria bacterium]
MYPANTENKSHQVTATQARLKMAACTVIALLATCINAQAQDLAETIAKAAGIPQTNAFLPDRYSVAKTQALPIDGVWMISAIRKKIRIEQGRAFALDPWLHLFVLKVQPDMVVMQNFRRTGNGTYMADDLPLLGPATMSLQADGNMQVNIQGKFGPVNYTLLRLEPQYPDAFNAEIAAATGQSVAPPAYAAPVQAPYPAPQPVQQPVQQPAPYQPAEPLPGMPVDQPYDDTSPGYTPEECAPINVDPQTGEMICA